MLSIGTATSNRRHARWKTDTCGQGVEEKEKSIVLLLTLKALKRNVFTIAAYVMFTCQFCQSATN